MLESLTRRPVPVAVGAVAVTLAITAAGIGLLTRGTDLRGQLDARVTEILEHSSVAEHHAHGHDFGGGPARVVCAVETFGYEPADAASVSQVRRVYAQHLCAVDEGGSWQSSIRASGPIAVEFGGSDRVLVPRSGSGYPERVRALIPARYQAAAFGTFTGTTAIDAARRRFETGRRP